MMHSTPHSVTVGCIVMLNPNEEENMIGFGCPTGVTRYDASLCYDGFTVVPPFFDTNTYLINMEGKLVHTWPSKYCPMSAYLEPDGTLTRMGRVNDPVIRYGGITGIIEQIDWDGNVIWSYEHNSEEKGVLSHNVCTMPNGNILAKVEKLVSAEEAYARGRIPGTLLPEVIDGKVHDGISNFIVIEIDKKSREIVWSWEALDHVGPNNYHTLDLNITEGSPYSYRTTGCWLNFNAMEYNPERDEFMTTIRNFGEIIIVSRKSGKIVWRWGNPANYGAGRRPGFASDGDQKLFGPHNPTFLPNGNILVHDNGWLRPTGNRSRVLEISRTTGEIVWSFEAKRATNFYSPLQSGAQRLPNGNTLVCSCAGGQIFEVTGGSDPRVIWEFTSPWIMGGKTTPFLVDEHSVINPACGSHFPELHLQNFVHRAYRYGKDFSGFAGHDLSHADPIDPRIQRYWEQEPWKSGYKESCRLTAHKINFVPVDGSNIVN